MTCASYAIISMTPCLREPSALLLRSWAKGLEQLDYLLSDLGQHDKFIDEDKLAEMFLSTMDKLGQLDEASEETDDGHGC